MIAFRIVVSVDDRLSGFPVCLVFLPKNSLVIRSRLGGNRAQNDERVTVCARVHLMIGRVAAIQNRGAVRIKAKRPKRCPQCKSPYWDVPRLKAARQGESLQKDATG